MLAGVQEYRKLDHIKILGEFLSYIFLKAQTLLGALESVVPVVSSSAKFSTGYSFGREGFPCWLLFL